MSAAILNPKGRREVFKKMNALKKAAKIFGVAALLILMCGCATGGEPPRPAAGAAVDAPEKDGGRTEDGSMRLQVQNGDTVIVFALNDSRAARELYAQLPLTAEAEDFGLNEKIFYPPEELSAEDAPQADGQKGTLAYYAPWGDVVMFYAPFEPSGSLYALGEAVSGMEDIGTLAGTLEISAAE